VSRILRCLVIAGLLVVTAHKAPAPIQETSESPTPVPEQSAKPKHAKSKVAAVESDKGEKSRAQKIPKSSPTPHRKFAGTWVGTMQTIPWGNLTAEVRVDSSETAMAVSWYEADKDSDAGKIHEHFKPAPNNRADIPAFAKAQLNGDTLTASFPAPLLGSSTWSITPQPDGTTASARMQAFANDFNAIFRRTANPPLQVRADLTGTSATRTATTQVPTAKPVPERPGFVYNPFDASATHLLDVRGKPSGTKVKDPSTGKMFIVP
jgi:hypothetical protein